MALTEKQKRFAFEYVKDFNATKAYIRAGYSEATAESSAHRLLDISGVKEEIEMWKDTNSAALRITPQWVLNQWAMIASADPSDLVSVTVRSCEACYEPEIRRQLEELKMDHALKVANPDCKGCEGKGVSDVWLADTRSLKGAARRLFAGAYKTKDGIKVIFRDQDGALKSIANYLGMEKNDQRIHAVVDQLTKPVKELTDAELMSLASAGPLQLEGGTTGGSSEQP